MESGEDQSAPTETRAKLTVRRTSRESRASSLVIAELLDKYSDKLRTSVSICQLHINQVRALFWGVVIATAMTTAILNAMFTISLFESRQREVLVFLVTATLGAVLLVCAVFVILGRIFNIVTEIDEVSAIIGPFKEIIARASRLQDYSKFDEMEELSVRIRVIESEMVYARGIRLVGVRSPFAIITGMRLNRAKNLA